MKIWSQERTDDSVMKSILVDIINPVRAVDVAARAMVHFISEKVA